MAAASCSLSEDQFLCCICLDVFDKPVTIPCGHNFCRRCIGRSWSLTAGSRWQCPMCKRRFRRRPKLWVNTFVSEMVAEYKRAAGKADEHQPVPAGPGEVPCDVCSEPKAKAVQSCLTCLASYCDRHLEPHRTSERLRRHVLSEPLEDVEDGVCRAHRQPLELFCRNDRTLVCSMCTVTDHASHRVRSLGEETEARREGLRQAEVETQQRIEERRLELQRFQRLKSYITDDAKWDIVSFHRVTVAVQKHHQSLIKTANQRLVREQQEADRRIRALQEEISTLVQRCSKIQKLSQTKDHFLVLKRSESLSLGGESSSRPGLGLPRPWSQSTALEGVEQLQELLAAERERLLGADRLERVRQYATPLLLDEQTANAWLQLSADGKEVRCGEQRRSVPENAQRFSLCASVLAQQRIPSGRFYFEVQVSGKTHWTVGVARASVDRKTLEPLSPRSGYWAMGLTDGDRCLCLGSPAFSPERSRRPERLGVFVAYEEGVVSFFDVGAAVQIHSFTDCCFSEELRPFFSPGSLHGGRNSAPLILSPN